MNTKLKIHQLKLQQWTELCKQQASGGLTVKDWCLKNNMSIHTYHYWKHLLKQEYIDSVLPDIVPLSDCHSSSLTVAPLSSAPVVSPATTHELHDSRDLHDSHKSSISNDSICISGSDTQIHVGASVSDDLLLRLSKAVRHA